MARKIVNRKEKRAEIEASERAETKKPAKKAEKKAADPKVKAPARKSSKRAVEARFKLFWGVFNHSMKRVALYDFNQRKQAEKKAEELSQSSKNQHFVQRVKEAVQE